MSGITKCDSYYKVRRSNANNECLKGKNIRLEFLEKQDQDISYNQCIFPENNTKVPLPSKQ